MVILSRRCVAPHSHTANMIASSYGKGKFDNDMATLP